MVMCFVPDCNHYSEQRTCRFFVFPKDPVEMKRWMSLIRREDREPSRYSLVCSCHFLNGERKNGPTMFNINRILNAENQIYLDSSENQFPRDPALLQKWLQALKIEGDWKWSISKSVCSKHFLEADFICRDTKKFLRYSAVPSTNLADFSSGTEIFDTMQDNIIIKIEEDESTDSAEESKRMVEPVFLLGSALDSKSSILTQTMTMPLDSNTSKNDEVADKAEQQAEFIARRTLEKNKEKIRSLHRKNRLLKRKVEKINQVFEELGKQCDIAQVSKDLSSISSHSNPIAEDSKSSSTESDIEEPHRLDKNLEENIKVHVVTNKPNVGVANNEKEATQINCLGMESQVQVTFLAGSDTAKEGLLKRKLKQLAENDVIKSKKIRELHNIVFVKNKLIGELKNEIAQLREFQKNQMQKPVIQYILKK